MLNKREKSTLNN